MLTAASVVRAPDREGEEPEPVGLLVCGPGGRVLAADIAAATLLGYHSDLLRDLPLVDLVHPADSDAVDRVLCNAAASPTAPVRMLDANGAWQLVALGAGTMPEWGGAVVAHIRRLRTPGGATPADRFRRLFDDVAEIVFQVDTAGRARVRGTMGCGSGRNAVPDGRGHPPP